MIMERKKPKIAMLGQNSTKATIAIVGPFPPSSGGICTNILNILNSPLKNRYNFFPFQTGSLKYGKPGYFNEKFYLKLYRVIKNLFSYVFFLFRSSPDIVHINTSFSRYSFWRDSFYLFLAKLFARKTLLQIHGGRLDEFRKKSSSFMRKLVKKILETPEQVLVLSSIQQKHFGNLRIKQKVKVIPNMIDVNKFNGSSNCGNNFDMPTDHMVILFVAAHFFREKGVWEVLKAIPLVVKEHKKAIFILVGGGLEENNMKKFCIRKGLQKYVRFPGHLYGKDIIKAFLASDIFILPSYNEGFPLTILEAMAAGLPIITTPVGAIPEVIEDGIHGFLVQPKDPQSLGEKIVQLIENKGLREEMSKNNLARVREKYDLKAVAKIFEGVYSELLSAK